MCSGRVCYQRAVKKKKRARKPKPEPSLEWSPFDCPPPAPPVRVTPNEALESLAQVLVPHVLGALHDRLKDAVSIEDMIGREAARELGFVFPPHVEDAEDRLIRVLAEEAVRIVRERWTTGGS